MNPDRRVIVVGGGIIGASIAYALTKRGAEVTLCEQSRPPGSGSTRFSGGLIRMHHTHPASIPWAWESAHQYAHWQEIIGGECGFRKTGFALIAGPEQTPHMKKNIDELKKQGIPVYLLDPDEYRELQPDISTEGIGAVAYEPYGGFADPIQATMSYLEQGQRMGLRVMEGTKVTRLLTQNGSVTGVETNVGALLADGVILCGNSWVSTLLEEFSLFLPVKPKRIGVCFVRWDPPNPTPPVLTTIDDTLGVYFRAVDPHHLLIGIRVRQPISSLETPAVPIREELISAKETLQVRYPALEKSEIMGGRMSFDGYTPDHHPIIGSVQGLPRVYLAVGFSGGGFKIAPAIGEAVARDWVEGDEAGLEPFRLSRFAEERPIVPTYPYVHM
ncbi:NAD(P)/FAD-dependent oxidoreductase [Salinithrix halophila]|uniref:NAD(P)/FAD-dependent oxidoreductase n=1 Tax=Salinithrix halophila TaxID=1485204 RepID=A0ABV8JCJ2_9BACL